MNAKNHKSVGGEREQVDLQKPISNLWGQKEKQKDAGEVSHELLEVR